MKRWVSYYVVAVALVVGLIVFLIARVNSPVSWTDMVTGKGGLKNQPGEIARRPEARAIPEDLTRLRRQRQLRPLTPAEDGIKMQDLPEGAYGFSMCDAMSVRARRSTPSLLEVHKYHDRIVYYVGYASTDDIEKYLARQKNFHIFLSSDPREKASSLLQIPVDFIAKCDVRPAGDGYLFDLFVASIPELQS
ncbi:MAG TPA: hypothetical protein VJ746_18005 [Nitrospira sp.]|nr:hypothetical protein [Nitrospira sp.]